MGTLGSKSPKPHKRLLYIIERIKYKLKFFWGFVRARLHFWRTFSESHDIIFQYISGSCFKEASVGFGCVQTNF